MTEFRQKYYPVALQAIHLIILYIFVQTVVDFPLALIDYYKDTEYLYHPVKKVLLGIGSTLFILYYGYRKSGVRISEIFPVKRFNPLILIPVITFFWGIHNILAKVNMQVEKLIPPPSWFLELFNRILESDYGLFGAFVKVSVTAPVIEELIFRGVIMHGFMKNYRGWMAVFLSALLFALFHLNPWQIPATFVLGLLLGWLMLVTRNIFLCILVHSLNNLLVLVSITFWEKIRVHPVYMIEEEKKLLLTSILVVVFSLAIMILILYAGRIFSRARN